ncbi:hypothetical protein FRC06_002783 [Ceratobasidium sp. 370]|nr:hypothetical protein FRC06_002783 [Ceratobasidium sp. 370]
MPTSPEILTVTPPVPDEEDLWGTKGIYIEDASSLTEISWPILPLGVPPLPGIHLPLRILTAPGLECAGAPRPTAKPKGPRPQPPKPVVKPSELQTRHSSNHHEPSVSTTRPRRTARGIYGDRPRLPAHRPSRYVSEYTCDVDRFAHLTPFRNQQTLAIDQHACVDIATMGLERFTIQEESEYMDLEEEAEFFRSLDVAVQPPSLPFSRGSVQLSFVTNGLRGALSNFRTRWGPGATRAAPEERVSGLEMVVEGSYVDIVCPG